LVSQCAPSDASLPARCNRRGPRAVITPGVRTYARRAGARAELADIRDTVANRQFAEKRAVTRRWRRRNVSVVPGGRRGRGRKCGRTWASGLPSTDASHHAVDGGRQLGPWPSYRDNRDRRLHRLPDRPPAGRLPRPDPGGLRRRRHGRHRDPGRGRVDPAWRGGRPAAGRHGRGTRRRAVGRGGSCRSRSWISCRTWPTTSGPSATAARSSMTPPAWRCRKTRGAGPAPRERGPLHQLLRPLCDEELERWRGPDPDIPALLKR
jgi:hypothetical protein